MAGRKRVRDVPGFCKRAGAEEIRGHGHILALDRYAGATPKDNDGEPFEQRVGRLAAERAKRQAESRRLDAVIQKNLKSLGFVTQDGIN